ncbi:unnamed protein product [Closterium sp. NIES-65]|nr:unnamed protein product [Closterium sp. NIES-65]
MSKNPFPTGSTNATTRPLELVHSDIMDLGDAHPSLRYVLTLKDDYTNYVWVAPLARRSDMAAVFSAWHREMKTKLPKMPLAALRTDNGGEYTSNAFTDYLSSHGINHQTSLPHTPQQNGVAERVNRTLMDRVRAMTTGASLSSKFWPYALGYAAWLHNRISCSSNPSAHSPYFMMMGKAADVSMARTFGCLCYFLPPQGSFGKFEQRGRAGMFLGLSNSRKAWIVRDLASDVDTDTRSARFFDDLMLPDAESLLERQRYIDEVSPHISEWTSGGEDVGSAFDSFPASLTSSTSSSDVSTAEQHGPTTNDAAQEDPPAATEADIGEETGESDLPAAGISVCEGADNNEPENDAGHLYNYAYPPDGIPLAAPDVPPRRVHFNPTVTVLGGEGQGMDKMTGLDVLFGRRQAGQTFTRFPNVQQQNVLGCAATDVPIVELTYKEPKTLHEITKDPYAPLWQAAVDAELAKFDDLDAYEVVDRADVPKGTPVLSEGVVLRDPVWLLTYVDDILIQSHDAEGIDAVIQHLKQHFTLTVSKTMTQFLGLNVAADNDSIALGLTKYISQALATFGMEGSRSGVRTPIAKEPGPQGEPPDEIDGQLVLKQVGTLLYISTAGRPDITYAAHVLARQASKPTAASVLGIHRVFNYLQNTANMGLVYGGGDLVLRGYTDSDYANEEGRHSVGGYVFTLGGAAVSWRTKRQTVIATSTAEAEYIALFEGAREATYLRRLCEDLGFQQQEPTVIFVDNQSAIALATGEQMSQRIKHMDVRYHWTRKAVRDGVVRPEYCPTTQQAADYLTKPLTAKQHLTCSHLCGLQPISHVTPSAPSTHIEAAGAALSSPGFSRGAEQHGIT